MFLSVDKKNVNIIELRGELWYDMKVIIQKVIWSGNKYYDLEEIKCII